jgi:hypothetical protein
MLADVDSMRGEPPLATAEVGPAAMTAAQALDPACNVGQRLLRHEVPNHRFVEEDAVHAGSIEGLVLDGSSAVRRRVEVDVDALLLWALGGPDDGGVRCPDLDAAGEVGLLDVEGARGAHRRSRAHPGTLEQLAHDGDRVGNGGRAAGELTVAGAAPMAPVRTHRELADIEVYIPAARAAEVPDIRPSRRPK